MNISKVNSSQSVTNYAQAINFDQSIASQITRKPERMEGQTVQQAIGSMCWHYCNLNRVARVSQLSLLLFIPCDDLDDSIHAAVVAANGQL